MCGLLDMLDPSVAESGRHRDGARVELGCLAHHLPHASSYHYGYACAGYIPCLKFQPFYTDPQSVQRVSPRQYALQSEYLARFLRIRLLSA